MSRSTRDAIRALARRDRRNEDGGRKLLSSADRRRTSVRVWLSSIQGITLLTLLAFGLGPLYWTFKGAVSPTQELLRHPLRLWPSDPQWGNLSHAWTDLRVGHYLGNTVILVTGSVIAHLVVATTGGYVLSVLRPKWATPIRWLVLATLFIPGSISLVALYLTVLDIPLLGISLVNTPWAVWLPHAASAFMVLIVMKFFDGIPRELFEAAKVDGAGPFTVFWRIVLPMSRPIVAVITVLTVMNAWKDFLWPLIAIPDTGEQPIAAALPRLAERAEQSVLIAAMLLAIIPPLLLFLIFQRQIMRGGEGFSGLKG
ncbi:carbohydrate ABC transporter permease [Wenjunlia vitaminophila]|uniref:carbohydrate ABC transporter permease n=1 Tax=Wenjunlia vitaminophila TaxID=76728 RepID=UPI0003643EB3|nr:carbohydrate ABC transporter permease [Wenjunlia vitaminophila]